MCLCGFKKPLTKRSWPATGCPPIKTFSNLNIYTEGQEYEGKREREGERESKRERERY